MATYGIYGSQYGASTPAPKKQAATDVFTNTSPSNLTAVQQGAQPNQSNPVTGAAPPNPFAAPPAPGAPAAPSMFPPVANAANPGSFETLLNNAGPARAQNVQTAQQSVSEQLMPSPGPSRESASARSSFIKAQAEAGRQNSEASSLSGRLSTGQLPGDVANFNRESLTKRADLENQLAVSDAKRNDQQKQQGVSNVLALEGLASGERAQDKAIASTEKLGFADLSIRERTLAQSGSQFDKELDFKKYAADKGYSDAEAQRAWQGIQNDKQITSSEKVAFAGLSLDEKKLAQAGSQFDKRLDFDTWAKTQDMDEEKTKRIWQSIENDKGRAFTHSESVLDRDINAYQFGENLKVTKQQIAEGVRQFDNKLDFDKWATKAGLDDKASARVWESNENEVGHKWQTGERLSTQEHQVNLTRLQGEVDKDKAAFTQTLGIKTLEKQAEIDKLTAETAHTYSRDLEGFKADLTAKLEQAGYDHDTAIKASEIQANSVEKQKDRDVATLEAKAELAYKYQALASEEGISKEQIAQRREDSVNQLNIGLAQLGLDTKKFDQIVKSQDFQDRTGVLSTMMELGGDNPDMADKAAEGFLKLMHEKGMITDDQFNKGITGIKKGTPPAAAPEKGSGSAAVDGVKRTVSGVDKIMNGDVIDGVGDSLMGQVDTVTGIGKDAYRGSKKLLRKLNPFG